jgi:hypothetical protein
MMNRHGVCAGLLVGLLGLTAGGCSLSPAESGKADEVGTATQASLTPDGYQLAADWNSPVDVGVLKGYLVAPPLPKHDDLQFVSFFPALVNPTEEKYLKPVLAYNWEDYEGWMAYGEYQAPGGIDDTSNVKLLVNPGDLIYYSIQGFSGADYCNSSGACLWRVTIEDVTQGNTVTLDETLNVPFRLVVGAALTTTGVDICSDLPAATVDFSNLAVHQWGNNDPLTPSWSVGDDTHLCNWSIDIESSSDVQLSPPPG